jgi:inosose dehydratase
MRYKDMGKAKIQLGIAPIGWTNDDLPELGGENTFEQCVSEMALAGYAGTEIGNKYPKEGNTLRKALEIRGLTVCNAWFSTFFTNRAEEETIAEFIRHRDFLFEQGAKVIGCSEQGNSIQGKPLSIFEHKPRYTEAEWKKVSEGMNRLADLAEEKGMKACYHHHMGTGIQTPEEIDEFLERTNKNVYLLYDTGHIVFSEGNVEAAYALIKKHIRRTVHVHLKDMRWDVYRAAKTNGWSFLRAVKEGVFTVPGDGMIDFKPVMEILNQNSYEGWVVVEAEQDPAKANPFEYAKKSYSYITSILK